MRVIFMGTPEFAVPSLRTLIASSYDVVAAFTQPDRPSGRGHKPQAPPVKNLALAHNIPVYQPEKVRTEDHRSLLQQLAPDFIVVVAYGQILPAWLLKTPRIAPVNIHGSLLPKYRGAAPIIWALLNGEPVTGITTMLMDEHIDTGPILLKREFPIADTMTAGDLGDHMARLGADMLIPTLGGLQNGSIKPETQDSLQASWAPRISKEQAEIIWNRSAREIHNQIRAFHPWPLAFTEHQGQRIQLLRSRFAGAPELRMHEPGTFLSKTGEGILVQCGDAAIEILELRPANRRAISGREFANGARFSPGSLIFHQRISPQGGDSR